MNNICAHNLQKYLNIPQKQARLIPKYITLSIHPPGSVILKSDQDSIFKSHLLIFSQGIPE